MESSSSEAPVRSLMGKSAMKHFEPEATDVYSETKVQASQSERQQYSCSRERTTAALPVTHLSKQSLPPYRTCASSMRLKTLSRQLLNSHRSSLQRQIAENTPQAKSY